jgi:hypothetical protein
MTNQEIFAAWSPENSLWSTWAKPVLFAHLGTSSALPPSAEASPDAGWSPTPIEKTALVLDLPGEEGVWVGVALAARGYRPVPLYNAVPLPFGVSVLDPLSQRSVAAVNVLPMITALRRSAEQLARMNIPPDAPPAFLLDANRHGDKLQMQPDEFDNRSICFTTDFPSANYLLTHRIQRALLIQRDRIEPQTDLAHVLRRWQDGGLTLERMRIDLPTEREGFQVSRPSWYGTMFQRALAALGLRRASGGGFGAWMPESSAGG